MKLNDVLEFRKDLFFEGAVQADWFYMPEKSSKVAENFVFHGSEYYGVDNAGLGSRARIDTISLVEKLLNKLSDENENGLSLAIADYGTGKSHLAVTLAHILSGADYQPETYNAVLSNISAIDKNAGKRIENLSKGKNFVMVINGMRDFNLHSEILKAAQKSLKLYGLSDEKLKKLNRALETAETFFDINKNVQIKEFEKAAKKHGWSENGEELLEKISSQLMVDDECFDIVNDVYSKMTGQEIRWDEGISAGAILELLVSEYCGMNGDFDHVIILFDEFGRFLEYASGVNPAKSGDSALQQIFEMTQNADGALHIINFIQNDIKQYLQRIDQTTNVGRYIGRYDASDKYYISSNLETVFANLIRRKDADAFAQCVVKWQDENESTWKETFELLNKWVNTKGMWHDYALFRKVIVEGIYPMHPIATFMLTQLSDYLQNRSSLMLISRYITDYSEATMDKEPVVIMPETLMLGDLYVEMLAAEQDGKQQSQQCIRYDNVLRKYGDKLSEKSMMVLRSNLIVRILRFRTTSYDDAKLAISICSGLSMDEITQELKWLEDEYAVLGFDDRNNCFDFMEESNGAYEFKVLKKRLMAKKEVDSSLIISEKIQDLAGIRELQTTNYATKHKITTCEWLYQQEMYPIENFTVSRVKAYIDAWKKAKNTITPKGKLVWLYLNKETDPDIVEKSKELVKQCEDMPIIFMLLNDAENRLLNTLLEYSVLDEIDLDTRKKYERHFNDDYSQAESNLKDEFEELKKKRNELTNEGVQVISSRVPIYLTDVFEKIYPDNIPFQFDGFVTKNNNIAPKSSGIYCSIVKMLLSDSVNENSIHAFNSEVRNRFEAVLMTTSNTSWKCVDTSYRVVPPETKSARKVFDYIVDRVKDDREFSCEELFDLFTAPPYGISEEVIFMMLAVVCAYYSYCIRFKVGGTVKTINNWKADAIGEEKKNKIDWAYIYKSSLIYVDGDAVSGKFSRFFDKVTANKDIFKVADLERELKELEMSDEVPEELQTARDLAVKTITSGKKARAEWDRRIEELDDKKEKGLEDFHKRAEIYNFVDALVDIKEFPLHEIFDENGYQISEEARNSLGSIRMELSDLLSRTGNVYVENMACTEIERLNTFKNHNMKLISKLKEIGQLELAKKIEKKKDEELNNQEEIKSRQALKTDLEKYLSDSEITRYITYVQIQGFIKDAEKLTKRYAKYGNSLGNAGKQLYEELELRLKKLNEAEQAIRDDMLSIWDDLDSVCDEAGIKGLLSRIQLVKQKGISKTDYNSFTEMEDTLKAVLEDIEIIREAEANRDNFTKTVEDIRNKYSEQEAEFDALSMIDAAIDEAEKSMDKKEDEWAKKYLSLGDKSRESVYKWKDATKFLPDYLSKKTKTKYKKLAEEAEAIISEGRIDDVLIQFEKLSDKEKKECLSKLEALL
ncbi:hypothetical protein [Butyrivibrio sp. YAB3001]|uniref:hypothetical protein n=1 Tax=Butyrivibrio sp. YAB3001 TaxID=1520812 RepID=UPI0008F66E74|nr:hypothetical protein [Butyrivibrio sp. YAB3001]SFC69995.1 hypothetical protein SAMN02910398_02910 [Butyrivibrio sp. YAB3001]